MPNDRDDLLFLYVAGALDEAERTEVEDWLASGAPQAAEQLARAEEEVALLAAAQPRADLPRTVRERLLARTAGAADRPPAEPAAAPRRPRRLAHPAFAALASGLLAASVTGVVVQRIAVRADAERDAALLREIEATRDELHGVREERASLDDDLADTESRLRALETDLVLARKTIGVLQAEHAEAVALTGTASAPTARGRVYWDWDAWYCYARVTGLPKDPGRTYAMWLFTEDDVVGVGTFHADAQGDATFLSPVPHLGKVVRAGISVEPDEDLGSKPRGDLVMVGEATPPRS